MSLKVKKFFIYLVIVGSFIIFLSYQLFRESHIKTTSYIDLGNSNKKNMTDPLYLNIKMAFFPQAPYADWSLPYQESCEEASVILVANLFNKLNLNREKFHGELLKLIEWEKERFGDYKHTDIKQTEIIINEYYKLKTVIHENPNIDDIVKILKKGNLIIAPFAGKLLDNPYFTNGGPKYHMLVIKGFNLKTQEIVTHDVGTKRGANFIYSWENINASIHDWNKEDMLLGQKVIIEVIH
jgi:hypothetical protein